MGRPLLLTLSWLATAAASSPDFCEIVSKDLPENCNCSGLPFGGSVRCKVFSLKEDAIDLQFDLAPCEPPAHVDVKVTEAKHGVNFTVANVAAGEERDIPVPALALDIPKIGNVGLDVSVDIEGNLDSMTLKVGLNACAAILGHKVCGSKLTEHLPFWVLHGTYHFGDFCKSSAAVAAAELVV
eukprot:TRINITY_DN54236_c0_g1_i1.p1 TRINITY_DN54236_c0_g1~~TRINITY_DN54236_c0_g1_i1.p1  ORF type:complete len:205 (-),score=45.86 TRINITY_DN54236_c0_g1_i1:90-638(-)